MAVGLESREMRTAEGQVADNGWSVVQVPPQSTLSWRSQLYRLGVELENCGQPQYRRVHESEGACCNSAPNGTLIVIRVLKPFVEIVKDHKSLHGSGAVLLRSTDPPQGIACPTSAVRRRKTSGAREASQGEQAFQTRLPYLRRCANATSRLS